MIIFLGEDRAYLAWVAHHRGGFVLDGLRKPTRKGPVLHRASCEEIRKAKARTTHWTTGRRFKACSLDQQELVAWSVEEFAAKPAACGHCQPLAETPPMPEASHELTKLGKDIVEYVVELAVIHLDQGGTPLEVAVQDVASYLGKTTGQIRRALNRLVEDGFLLIVEPVRKSARSRQDRIYPTVRSLKLLPAFEKLPDSKIQAQLHSLMSEK